ncbi:MAG: DEAD/DEAH box helicase [Deltaproteobacteria bacterium]|nr:DEAD/DEAH box helicase [Deltaproteobacteria bacterium]
MVQAKKPATTKKAATTAAPLLPSIPAVHPIVMVRSRLMGAGLERVLLNPFADVVPQLFRFSRRGARLAERLIADRPLLSASSALAELGGQVQDPERARSWAPGRSPVAAGIPRVLIDKLAFALHRFVDVNGKGPPSGLAFGDGIAPGPVAPELKGVLEAVLDLRKKLGSADSTGAADPAFPRKRARVTLDEGPPPGFFFTEDAAAVPAGMLLSLEDVDARKPLGFVGVRGPLGSIETQRYAVERVLDIVMEPLFDEGPRLQRLAGGRFGALLAALDELVVVDEDEPRLCWRVVVSGGGLSLKPMVRGAGVRPLEDRIAGKKLEETIRTLPFSTAQDLEIARSYVLRNERLDGVVAERLVDHPLLELADGRPARALHARPVVVVRDNRTLEFQAAGRPLDAHLLGEDGAGVVVDGDQARVLAVPVTPAQRTLARAVARLGAQALPQGVLDDVVSRLKRGKLEVLLPTSLRGDRVAPSSSLVVRVSWRSRESGGHGGARFSIVARPLAGGPTFVPGHGPQVVFADAAGGRALWCERDLAAEDAAAKALIEAVGVDDDDVEGSFRFGLLSPARALAALTLLSDRSDVVLALAADGPRVSSVKTAQLRVRLGKRTDWLGLDGEVTLDDGTRLSLQSLLEALREGRRYVVIDKDRIAALSAELAGQLAIVAGFSGAKAASLAAGSVAVVDEAMQALADSGADITSDAGWDLARIDVAKARDVDGVAPPGIQATLRPYQEEGLRFLRRLACWGTGAVLADDMGLGKTLVTTCLLVDRAASGPALVVAPTSLGFHWAAEIARFAPMLRARVYGEGDAKKRTAIIEDAGPNDVVIASYGLVQRDLDRFLTRTFSTLVVDEAQAVKNASTHRAQAIRKVPAAFRVALTGTPIENHTGELWSIFDLVSPGLFGTFTQWKARWASPIEKDDDVERRKLLARTIRPFLLRRRKIDVAKDLPAKTVVTRVLTLSPEEKHAYERLRLALIADLERGDDEREPDAAERRVQILAALTRLRLCACHPVFAADVVDEAHVPIGTKQRALVDLVAELREAGHKCLVFSQFVRHLTLARRFLDESGAKTLLLTGQTPAADRRDLVEKFQNGDADVFLISLKAGGFGLNLTRASYVVHLDPWWNPAVEEQASDRAHRIGQTLPVTVLRLVAGDTLEEPILQLHERKKALADGILEGSETAGKLHIDELMSLVKTSRRFDGSPGQEVRGAAGDDDDG